MTTSTETIGTNSNEPRSADAASPPAADSVAPLVADAATPPAAVPAPLVADAVTPPAAAAAPRIVVLIPAHNEAARIAATVEAARSIAGVSRVMVVDDGSEDGTAEAAKAAGAQVIEILNNVGKGAALEHGAKRAEDADIVLLLDGDLGETAAQGSLLLAPVIAGEADMTIASFPRPSAKAGFGLVMRLARGGIAALGGPFEATAPLSGQRALTAECMMLTRPFATGYGVEVALTIRALRHEMRLLEVPTTMAHAATGRNVAGFVHRGRQFVHVALALMKLTFEPRHPRH